MIVKTGTLNFEETKSLMMDLMNTKSKFIMEYGIFNTDEYWLTHFILDYQYNINSKWIHQIDIESDMATYIILKYCSYENPTHQ